MAAMALPLGGAMGVSVPWLPTKSPRLISTMIPGTDVV